ncbi:MAG: MFS transporter [Acidobacteria bacterium]|nr:MFS transporter [Acidobacteriota bacterium]
MTNGVAEPGSAALEPAGSPSVAIVMYSVMLLSYALMAANRFLLPTVATNVRQEFGFTLARSGLLTTIFTVGLGLGGLPTGYLLARFTRKTVLLGGIAIFSSAVALTTLATGFWTLLLCLAVMGIGMAMEATVMFALAASYFYRNRAAAIGSVNFCYGLGGIVAPLVASWLLKTYGNWRSPMMVFGLAGFMMVVLIALVVRHWFSETRRATGARAAAGGAPSLMNRNTILLTIISLIYGLVLYGFLGMYPTFLRDALKFTPTTAGSVYSFFGVGALLSILGGWLGDRLSPKVVLTTAFLTTALLGYGFVHAGDSAALQRTLTFAYGVVGSAVLYVNLAGYHVKAVESGLASRGSGMFVTSLYTSSAAAGYFMGWLANQGGWATAFGIQISSFSIVAAVLALALRPNEMAS